MDCPLLTQHQADRLLDMLPDDRHMRGDPWCRGWALEQIEDARLALWLADRSSSHLLSTKPVRRATRRRLDELRQSIEGVTAAVRALEPLDIQLLARRPDRATNWIEEQLLGVLILQGRAARTVEKLDRLPSRKGGAPRVASAELLFARSLSSLWVYFAGRSMSIVRDGRRGLWPFKDFVQAVGRTVIPGFSGETACRDLQERMRAIRRRQRTGREQRKNPHSPASN